MGVRSPMGTGKGSAAQRKPVLEKVSRIQLSSTRAVRKLQRLGKEPSESIRDNNSSAYMVKQGLVFFVDLIIHGALGT